MSPPAKSWREGLITAVVVGAVVYVLVRFGLAASSNDALLVVALFTWLSFMLDLVRGRYRRPEREDVRALWAQHLAEPFAVGDLDGPGADWAAWDSAVAGLVGASFAGPLSREQAAELGALIATGRERLPMLRGDGQEQMARLLRIAELVRAG